MMWRDDDEFTLDYFAMTTVNKIDILLGWQSFI